MASNANLKVGKLSKWQKRYVEGSRLCFRLLSDDERQTYISASRHASSVIAEVEDVAKNMSFSSRSNPCLVLFLAL